jgi:hypothetical protein
VSCNDNADWKKVSLSNHRHRFVNNAELHIISVCITKTIADAPACVRSLISEPCASYFRSSIRARTTFRLVVDVITPSHALVLQHLHSTIYPRKSVGKMSHSPTSGIISSGSASSSCVQPRAARPLLVRAGVATNKHRRCVSEQHRSLQPEPHSHWQRSDRSCRLLSIPSRGSQGLSICHILLRFVRRCTSAILRGRSDLCHKTSSGDFLSCFEYATLLSCLRPCPLRGRRSTALAYHC